MCKVSNIFFVSFVVFVNSIKEQQRMSVKWREVLDARNGADDPNEMSNELRSQQRIKWRA